MDQKTRNEMNEREKERVQSRRELFLTYVRTLQLMRQRLRGVPDLENDNGGFVFIEQKEIEQRFFVYPAYNRKQSLQQLVADGVLEIRKVESKGKRARYEYKALQAGAINLSLLEPRKVVYLMVSQHMVNCLKLVTLKPDSPSTPYFDCFLEFKDKYINHFFTVDQFANRVHTPVTNFHREYRKNILLDGRPVVSFDVKTMQPLLLGKILKDEIGQNEYTNWINEGKDIYVMLQEKAGLKTRDDAKKKFFAILFSRPSDSLVDMFGQSGWIVWINRYKEKVMQANPHNYNRPHTNLAWLLQSTEVEIMLKIWKRLTLMGIKFLSIHDEIMVMEGDRHQAESIMNEILSREFTYYKLNVK